MAYFTFWNHLSNCKVIRLWHPPVVVCIHFQQQYAPNIRISKNDMCCFPNMSYVCYTTHLVYIYPCSYKCHSLSNDMKCEKKKKKTIVRAKANICNVEKFFSKISFSHHDGYIIYTLATICVVFCFVTLTFIVSLMSLDLLKFLHTSMNQYFL